MKPAQATSLTDSTAWRHGGMRAEIAQNLRILGRTPPLLARVYRL